jgi:hypothetical protein
MITTDQGVYLQFFDEDEASDRALPLLGPFELLIVRHNRLIGDREAVSHDTLGVGSVERWLEAELELRRALGDEPGGVRRSHMRFRAALGDIIVRFYDYAGDEAPKVPELGPFYSLVVGKREVRADDKLVAIRSTDVSPWTLTDAVRPGIAGINKSDFSVFALSARDVRPAPRPQPPVVEPPAAPVIAPLPEVSEPPPPAPVAADNGAPTVEPVFLERRKIQREIYIARPLPNQAEQLTPADVNLILRVDKLKQQELAQQLMVERLRREQHVDPETSLRADALASVPMRFQPPVKERVTPAVVEEEVEYEDVPFREQLFGFLWSARLFIVSGLILIALVAAYGYLRAPSSPIAGPKARTSAAMGERIQTGDWTYTVMSVDRPNVVAPLRRLSRRQHRVHETDGRCRRPRPEPVRSTRRGRRSESGVRRQQRHVRGHRTHLGGALSHGHRPSEPARLRCEPERPGTPAAHQARERGGRPSRPLALAWLLGPHMADAVMTSSPIASSMITAAIAESHDVARAM